MGARDWRVGCLLLLLAATAVTAKRAPAGGASAPGEGTTGVDWPLFFRRSLGVGAQRAHQLQQQLEAVLRNQVDAAAAASRGEHLRAADLLDDAIDLADPLLELAIKSVPDGAPEGEAGLRELCRITGNVFRGEGEAYLQLAAQVWTYPPDVAAGAAVLRAEDNATALLVLAEEHADAASTVLVEEEGLEGELAAAHALWGAASALLWVAQAAARAGTPTPLVALGGHQGVFVDLGFGLALDPSQVEGLMLHLQPAGLRRLLEERGVGPPPEGWGAGAAVARRAGHALHLSRLPPDYEGEVEACTRAVETAERVGYGDPLTAEWGAYARETVADAVIERYDAAQHTEDGGGVGWGGQGGGHVAEQDNFRTSVADGLGDQDMPTSSAPIGAVEEVAGWIALGTMVALCGLAIAWAPKARPTRGRGKRQRAREGDREVPPRASPLRGAASFAAAAGCGLAGAAWGLAARAASSLRRLSHRLKHGLPPDQFICPIRLDVMDDPVICSDGFTYERAAISAWLHRHRTSPKTNQVLSNPGLIPNHALRSLIGEWREAHGLKQS